MSHTAMTQTTMTQPSGKTSARLGPVEDEQMGVVAYLLQGAGFIGFLLVLFFLAGFRG